MATADEYERWYHTPRGRWIGDTEFQTIVALLRAEPGATLLDVGCGTGYFTRRLAAECRLAVTGLDPNADWLAYARARGGGSERYCLGRAERLPFADRSFDYAVSITALCFVDDVRAAIREMARVTRRRLVVGMLNRRSLLYGEKGRHGGSGAYRGARWHTAEELRAQLEGLPLGDATVRSAIFLPRGGPVSRTVERLTPGLLPFGAFLAMAADIRLG